MARRRSLPDHLDVPWGASQAIAVFALVWIGLPLAVLLLTRQLAPVLPPLAAFLSGLRGGNVDALFVETVIDAVAGLALIGYLLRRYHVGWSAVGWQPFRPGRAALLIVGGLVAFTLGVTIVLALVAAFVPGFNPNQAQTNDFTGAAALHQPILAIFALVIIPPIIEETTFRGVIFPALSKRFGVIFGAVSSSILFGFAHLQANVSLYTWLLGVLLCVMYVRLRSIIPGIILHMLNNLLAFLAIAGRL